MPELKKTSFIKSIRFWGILFLTVLSVIIITKDVVGTYRDANRRAEVMRAEFIDQQKRLIKHEVDRVADIINHETVHSLELVKQGVKARVYEAHALAMNLYEQNKNKKDETVIREMIIEALRPIRFNNDEGYYFITGLDGISQLFADRPELEGQNLLPIQSSRDQSVVRDLINIANQKGEGFYQYYWTKPKQQGKDFLKISYVKKFEPFDWYIGTGGYYDGIEQSMQQVIRKHAESRRFGIDDLGYVFILELLDIQGGKDFALMYANVNRPDLIGKPVSDDLKDAKGKMFRKEFLKGLREYDEVYVNYWYKKFDNPDPSPKTSYFKLAGDRRFIVAAGIYLDDVEADIAVMQAGQIAELKVQLLTTIFVIVCIALSLIYIYNLLSKKLAQDFSLFNSFFQKAAHSETEIDRSLVKFSELDEMAIYANQMLQDKIYARQNLMDEREQLLVTLHSIVDGVVTTDNSGKVVLMNRVAEDLSGWTQAEADGKHYREVLKTSAEETVDKEIPAAVPFGIEQSALLLSRYGNEYHITRSVAPIKDSEGNIRGTVMVFRDETENLRTEEELLKAKKLESVGILAGGIAHDFNNILAGLFGNLELAKRKMSPEHESRKYIDVAHQALERAISLTKQLLTFAKGGDPVLEALNLQQIIGNVVSFNLTGSPVKAALELAEDLRPVQADKGQLSQVIANLTINAKQAMPDGGTLHVTAENFSLPGNMILNGLSGDYIKLTIRDEGTGIPAAHLDRIFDPYFSTKQEGSGLGLATVNSIIRKHNGSIGVTSKPEIGTTFTIQLPAASASPAAVLVENKSVESAGQPSRHILVMDDEEIVRDVLLNMLTYLGHHAQSAKDGFEAKQAFLEAERQGNPFDLAFLDLTVPGGMGGKETIKELLAIDPEVKAIAISGYATNPILANFEKYGFKGRMEKPFQLEAVQAELSRVLG